MDAEKGEEHIQDSVPQEELADYTGEAETLSVRDIRKVKIAISAQLGHCPMLVRDVLELQPGSVLHLDKQAGEMADIFLGGLHFARGEVVVLGDVLHVRIAEIVGLTEREQSEYA